jgi:hypothetical protein
LQLDYGLIFSQLEAWNFPFSRGARDGEVYPALTFSEQDLQTLAQRFHHPDARVQQRMEDSLAKG